MTMAAMNNKAGSMAAARAAEASSCHPMAHSAAPLDTSDLVSVFLLLVRLCRIGVLKAGKTIE